MGEPFDHHQGRRPLLQPAPWGRFIICLAVNVALYAFANSFWHYLDTGQWLDLWPSAYAADFTSPTALADLFEHPLSVLNHAWMIAVGGVLIGIVIFVPIIVAVLCPLWAAMIFVAIVAIIGHAPVLAATLAVGCVLAARTKLRSNASYLAALLGILPIVPYMYFFAFAGTTSQTMLPIQRWALMAPLALSVVSAVVAFVAVLALARLTKYRRDAVWPVLAAMLAVPVAAFYIKIGPAEVAYQIITSHLAAGDAIFEPQDRQAWIRASGAKGLVEQAMLMQALGDVERKKQELANRCQRFLRRHAGSERAAAVSWVLAQCCDMQLDRRAFEQGWIKTTAAHPAPLSDELEGDAARRAEMLKEAIQSSQAMWQRIGKEYSYSPQAGLAAWRDAVLTLRRISFVAGDANAANEALSLALAAQQELAAARAAVDRVASSLAACSRDDKGSRLFSPSPQIPGGEYYEQSLLKIRYVLWLIARNDVLADANAAHALADYLQINPYGLSAAEHQRALAELAGKYESTPMADNLRLAMAMAESDPSIRAERLAELAGTAALSQPAAGAETPDAAIEASFELGNLLLQQPLLRGQGRFADPQAFFQRVRAAGASPWREQAIERLKVLESAAGKSP